MSDIKNCRYDKKPIKEVKEDMSFVAIFIMYSVSESSLPGIFQTDPFLFLCLPLMLHRKS